MGDAIQPSHPLLSPSPPTLNLSQHQGPGDLPNPVIKPTSHVSYTLAGRFFTTSATLEAQNVTQFDFRQL